MCFTVSIFASTHTIETEVGAVFDSAEEYQPYVYVTGFVFPRLPFITNKNPGSIEFAEWGLIPRWTKDEAAACDLRKMTLNARCETVYEKPSFRDAVTKRRGLLPVQGFIEWQHEGNTKLPHLVRMQNKKLFTLGCIWEDWINKEHGEVHRTFSIVTTQANMLMSRVHNQKQRMPVIIQPSDREAWLHAEDREIIEPLFRPLEDGVLEAFQVTREVSVVKVNREEEELLEPMGPVFS